MKKGKKFLFAGALLLLAFVVWTFLIQVVDVSAAGVNGSNIGFSAFNRWFFEFTGVHLTLYTITDWMGIVPVFVCMAFALVGLVQFAKRKSLFKVDADILILGIYYLAVITAYLVFEMIPVNYRPILINGYMEASYPSSTTLLVLCVMPTLAEQINRRYKSGRVKSYVMIFINVFSVFVVVGRLFSGVHWFTDIAGGVLLSTGLFFVYKGLVLCFVKKNNKED